MFSITDFGAIQKNLDYFHISNSKHWHGIWIQELHVEVTRAKPRAHLQKEIVEE